MCVYVCVCVCVYICVCVCVYIKFGYCEDLMRYKANDKTDLKNNRIISLHFQGKPFNITVIQVYTPITNAQEAEVDHFYEALQHLLELTQKKRCPFHHKGLECK